MVSAMRWTEMSDLEKVKAIIAKIPYITIASVSEDGNPWNTPVFGAYDEKYNFYWGSHKNSQHSRNIRANENVFLVIYDSTVKAGTGAGAYIKAVAEELNDQREIEAALKLLHDRHGLPYWEWEEVQGNAPARLYKAVPEKVWKNSSGEIDGIFIDTRVEVDLL